MNTVDNRETLKIYQDRRDRLCDGLNRIGWKVSKPKATFYIWAKVPVEGMSSAEFASEVLKKAHVLIIPGNGYGPTGEGYVRMSLTLLGDQDGERFDEVVRRIQASGCREPDPCLICPAPVCVSAGLDGNHTLRLEQKLEGIGIIEETKTPRKRTEIWITSKATDAQLDSPNSKR